MFKKEEPETIKRFNDIKTNALPKQKGLITSIKLMFKIFVSKFE